MKLYIKNMVSIRCKMIVKSELQKLGLRYTTVELGEVGIDDSLTPLQHDQLAAALKGFELKLMDEKKDILLERIKNVIIETIHYSDEALKVNFSTLLVERLGYNYSYLANLFSKVEGTTIQHFILKHKIERAKELLAYDRITLTEVAYRLRYSSVAHLSNQFKQITGHTPTFFIHQKHKRLNVLESI